MEEYWSEEYTEPCPHQYILGGVCQGDDCGMHMYSTGLQDKNHRDIYEGMTLRNEQGEKFRVYWDDRLTWCTQNEQDDLGIEWLNENNTKHLEIV